MIFDQIIYSCVYLFISRHTSHRAVSFRPGCVTCRGCQIGQCDMTGCGHEETRNLVMKPLEGMITRTLRRKWLGITGVIAQKPFLCPTCRTAAVRREAVKGTSVLEMDCKEGVGLGAGNKQDGDGFWWQECYGFVFCCRRVSVPCVVQWTLQLMISQCPVCNAMDSVAHDQLCPVCSAMDSVAHDQLVSRVQCNGLCSSRSVSAPRVVQWTLQLTISQCPVCSAMDSIAHDQLVPRVQCNGLCSSRSLSALCPVQQSVAHDQLVPRVQCNSLCSSQSVSAPCPVQQSVYLAISFLFLCARQ